MPRKEQGWITFQSSEEERKILEDYCQQSQRTKTEILRELVRNLDRTAAEVPPSSPQPRSSERQLTPEPLREPDAPKTLKISARNILSARVKRVVWGSVNAEVTLEIDPAALISIITRTSAEQMELTEGKQVYAVIKSSSVMLAED
ncbi:TOBE domain-containing protein [Leptolyngbya sp. FACHB-36]|uniref:TOBE domain-containing protein n=1 Tax=Leptolyngbya sp. FACHB-36 TaxID=2692808 RepID=UPI001680F0B6|nr:molybdopterin-binding protein [Leptolyngbya sp. FACHB-36]MBD2021233.1 TOBE domain-containing protein [Leptolyngbya sp. FACHB-36]